MIEKNCSEGKVAVNVDVSILSRRIKNTDPMIEGDDRWSYTPTFSHKVGSAMQIKNELKGNADYDGYELVWDDDLNNWVMRPVANTSQRSIFDADFREAEARDEDEEAGTPALTGAGLYLPAPEEDGYGEDDEDEEDG